MRDERVLKLAHNLITRSANLQKGQSIIIEGTHESRDLIIALVRKTYEVGGYPFVRLSEDRIGREVLMGVTPEYSKLAAKYAKPLFEEADAYIGIGAATNVFETADVPAEKKNIHSKHYGRPIHIDIRVAKGTWTILRWPNPSMAQLAKTSQEAFEDFYFDVCNLDYGKMERAMQPLKELIEKTDQVRIIAPDTDLTFSLKGQKAVICSGLHNIPDGEIFTSPVRESVNGTIRFNIPSLHKGHVHENVVLKFKDGRVINHDSTCCDALTNELDADEGARYIGEFAFGVNPYITKSMYDTLFDEKMGGSIHFALGNCYDDAPNGNKSQLHWDIIQSHLPEFGGGEVWFDGVLIRKNGLFVHGDLIPLNPEHLK
ncbi:MAG: aminopeptidase [Firmicutes bacterium]|nr:aminopeptidase [Bacillota bacterium]